MQLVCKLPYHSFYIAYALKGIIQSTIRQLHQYLLYGTVMILGVDKFRGTKFLGYVKGEEKKYMYI